MMWDPTNYVLPAWPAGSPGTLSEEARKETWKPRG